jgi:hypothetical protein
MKIKLLLLLAITIVSNYSLAIAQGEEEKYAVMALTGTTGIFLPSSIDFQDHYNTSAAFNWSIGLQIGNSDWNFFPRIQYSQFSVRTDSVLSKSPKDDSIAIARRQQILLGFINPIQLKNNLYLQLKYGVSYNLLSEETTRLSSNPFGFNFSFGFMKRISKSLAYNMDLSYEYIITDPRKYYRDWSGFMINFGLNWNLAANKTWEAVFSELSSRN